MEEEQMQNTRFPGGGGDSHIKVKGVIVGKFD